MTIRVIYTAEPQFPATDQHPNATRYKVGAYWVDAIGPAPTQQEVDAVLNTPVSAALSAAELAQLLKAKGVITDAEVTAAAKSEIAAL